MEDKVLPTFFLIYKVIKKKLHSILPPKKGERGGKKKSQNKRQPFKLDKFNYRKNKVFILSLFFSIYYPSVKTLLGSYCLESLSETTFNEACMTHHQPFPSTTYRLHPHLVSSVLCVRIFILQNISPPDLPNAGLKKFFSFLRVLYVQVLTIMRQLQDKQMNE